MCLVNKDTYTVGKATNLAGSGGRLLNMLVDFRFPCEGYILSLKYYRVLASDYCHVGIWEPIDGFSIYKLIYTIKLPAAAKGYQIITLNKPLFIKRDYIIAFHHRVNGPHVVSNEYNCVTCSSVSNTKYLSFQDKNLTAFFTMLLYRLGDVIYRIFICRLVKYWI